MAAFGEASTNDDTRTTVAEWLYMMQACMGTTTVWQANFWQQVSSTDGYGGQARVACPRMHACMPTH
jgi:hypothetical protein